VSFPQVWEPKQINGTGTAKYNLSMLFRVAADPAKPETAKEKGVDITPMKQAVGAVLVAQFGPDKTKWPAGLSIPFRDGKDKQFDGYGPGVIFIGASSSAKNPRPGIVGPDGKTAITTPNEFYGGCYARATVNAFYWEFMGKKGVSFGLQNIQKTRDGLPFSGRAAAEDDFDAIPLPNASEGGAPSVGAADNDPLAGIG